MLGGKFRVERIVGRGGMGVVLEATNTQIDQKVALKLLARGADDPAMAERFTREAKAAAKLRSEHVARVYDVGRDATRGPFIVMEMLDGKTLAEIVKEGRLAVHRAVEHLIDACEGLAEAHARGIIHQDVKPANLFVVTGDDGRPCVKLLDFGIATMRTHEERKQDGKSRAPRSQGTPAYLAPEQLLGTATLDHRADILGARLRALRARLRCTRVSRAALHRARDEDPRVGAPRSSRPTFRSRRASRRRSTAASRRIPRSASRAPARSRSRCSPSRGDVLTPPSPKPSRT